MSETKQKGFATRAIHDGQEPEQLTGAVSVPIYATSTYQQDALGAPRLGYEYARVTNPTRDRLEANLASLEGGLAARVFASGMAAVTAFCMMMKLGDHVVAGDNLYGGSVRFFNQVMADFGITFTYVDTRDPAEVAKAIRPETRYVFLETPTNPLMSLTDIAAVSQVAHAKGVEVIVDNTFMSPFFQRPLELGADMVLHSTTKYLNGHSDGLGGVIVCSTQQQADKLAFLQKASGGIMSPFECFLILRGVKTLAVRMKQHDVNGRRVAEYLSKHPKVAKVLYPGLASHPQHELALRQMKGFGGMITFDTGSLKNAEKVLKAVKVCTLAESLGGVETLISHPASMTHAAVGAEGRAKIGLTDGMVRISVGIEEVEDILADLDQALAVL
ncbi:MAG: PLP-dependent aspartate aminotransferase family protein [Acidobacteriota bacterium]|nr:PLP-dependent aspartate aminotransferase family protein [Acidobacteriota bacterium]